MNYDAYLWDYVTFRNSEEYQDMSKSIYDDVNHNESSWNWIPGAESYSKTQIESVLNAYINLMADEDTIKTYKLAPYNAGAKDKSLITKVSIMSSQLEDIVEKVLDRLYYNTKQRRGIESSKFLDPLNYYKNKSKQENIPEVGQSWVDKWNPISSPNSQGLFANIKDIIEGTVMLTVIGGIAYIGYQIYQGSKK